MANENQRNEGTTGRILEGLTEINSALTETKTVLEDFLNPYTDLESKVNFPVSLRNEYEREENGRRVKYVGVVQNPHIRSAIFWAYGSGKAQVTRYILEPIKKKVKRPVQTTVMKKRFVLFGKRVPIEQTRVIKEEVETGEYREVKAWEITATARFGNYGSPGVVNFTDGIDFHDITNQMRGKLSEDEWRRFINGNDNLIYRLFMPACYVLKDKYKEALEYEKRINRPIYKQGTLFPDS